MRFEQITSNILNLTYGKNIDLSIYERNLSENSKLRMRQLALVLSKR